LKFFKNSKYRRIISKGDYMKTNIKELNNKSLSIQRKINSCYFQIDLELPQLDDLNYEGLNDANEFLRFRNNGAVCKLKLTPLNDAAHNTGEHYDTFDEMRIYTPLLKDEREEGYYHIDLVKDGKANWQFRLRSLEITNLINHPEEIGA
jgi:hypothetical protein